MVLEAGDRQAQSSETGAEVQKMADDHALQLRSSTSATFVRLSWGRISGIFQVLGFDPELKQERKCS
jgi:hypothetical protein